MDIRFEHPQQNQTNTMNASQGSPHKGVAQLDMYYKKHTRTHRVGYQSTSQTAGAWHLADKPSSKPPDQLGSRETHTTHTTLKHDVPPNLAGLHSRTHQLCPNNTTPCRTNPTRPLRHPCLHPPLPSLLDTSMQNGCALTGTYARQLVHQHSGSRRMQQNTWSNHQHHSPGITTQVPVAHQP